MSTILSNSLGPNMLMSVKSIFTQVHTLSKMIHHKNMSPYQKLFSLLR